MYTQAHVYPKICIHTYNTSTCIHTHACQHRWSLPNPPITCLSPLMSPSYAPTSHIPLALKSSYPDFTCLLTPFFLSFYHFLLLFPPHPTNKLHVTIDVTFLCTSYDHILMTLRNSYPDVLLPSLTFLPIPFPLPSPITSLSPSYALLMTLRNSYPDVLLHSLTFFSPIPSLFTPLH